MTSPRVSVIVPHYSDLTGLSLCLDALERQTFPREDYEIIVADNTSPEGQDAVMGVIAGRARLVIVEERGAGPARNGGAAATRGVVFAFTDSDCSPSPQWLDKGVAALNAFDVVGGAIRVSVRDEHSLSGPEAFERVFAFKNDMYVEKKGFTVTANLFCLRETFTKVGGFRNGVPEDVDWSHRATAMGYHLGYCKEAAISHPARSTWGELKRKWRRLDREALTARPKSLVSRLRWIVKALLLPLSAAAHTPYVVKSPDLTSSRQRLSALLTLYRLRCWRALHAFALLLPHRSTSA